jgi:uncharacterized protein with PQ loop repeat
MKEKSIENMLLYKLNEHICRVFVSSLLGNGLFLLLSLRRILEQETSILTLGSFYFCSIFLSSYLIVAYLSNERRLLSKEGISKWLIIHFILFVGIFILAANLYYFLVVQRMLLMLPTLAFFVLFLSHVYLGSLFDLYEKNDEKLNVLLKRNSRLLLEQRKICLWYFVMLLGLFGIEQIDSWLLVLFFPGAPFVLTAYIKSKEAAE